VVNVDVFSTTGRTTVSGFSKAKAKIDAAIREDAEADGADPEALAPVK